LGPTQFHKKIVVADIINNTAKRGKSREIQSRLNQVRMSRDAATAQGSRFFEQSQFFGSSREQKARNSTSHQDFRNKKLMELLSCETPKFEKKKCMATPTKKPQIGAESSSQDLENRQSTA